MIYVGVDTGVNTGFSEWDSKKRCLLSVCSLPIHKAMVRVKELHELHGKDLVVRVEDPRQRTWFGTERMTREEERKTPGCRIRKKGCYDMGGFFKRSWSKI